MTFYNYIVAFVSECLMGFFLLVSFSFFVGFVGMPLGIALFICLGSFALSQMYGYQSGEKRLK